MEYQSGGHHAPTDYGPAEAPSYFSRGHHFDTSQGRSPMFESVILPRLHSSGTDPVYNTNQDSSAVHQTLSSPGRFFSAAPSSSPQYVAASPHLPVISSTKQATDPLPSPDAPREAYWPPWRDPADPAPTPQPPRVCATCDKQVDCLRSLQLHQIQDHACAGCFTLSYREFETHVMGHVKQGKPLKCSVCSFEAGNQHSFDSHLEEHIDSTSTLMVCKVCGHVADDDSEIRQHVKNHRTGFQCWLCSRQFTSRLARNRHVQSFHVVDASSIGNFQRFDFICGVCCGWFTSSEQLKAHGCKGQRAVDLSKSVTSERGRFRCEMCSVRFCSRAEVVQHMSSEHVTQGSEDSCDGETQRGKLNLSTSQCNLCEASMPSEESLATHVQQNHGGGFEQRFIPSYPAETENCMFDKEIKSENGKMEDSESGQESSSHSDEVITAAPSSDRESALVLGCSVCFVQFGSLTEVLEHFTALHPLSRRCPLPKRPQNKGKYRCDSCESKFSHLNDLIVHKLSRFQVKPLYCLPCRTFYHNQNDFLGHFCQDGFSNTSFHRNRIIRECDFCQAKIKGKEYLEKHIIQHLKGKIKLISPQNFKTHTDPQTGDYLFLASPPSQPGRPVRSVVLLQRYKCNLCHVQLAKWAQLYSHSQEAHRDIFVPLKVRTKSAGPYECDECGHGLNSLSDLQSHKMRHRGLTPFPCRFCTAMYANKSGLKHHTNTQHAAVKRNQTVQQLECPVCRIKCVSKKRLEKHLRNHTENEEMNSRPEPIKLSIKRSGSSHVAKPMSRAVSKMLTHYKCNLCGSTFGKWQELFVHSQKAHKDNFIPLKARTKTRGPYKCDECGHGLNSNADLQNHKMRHRGLTPFPCKFCNAMYANKSGLKHHYKSQHVKAERKKSKKQSSEWSEVQEDRENQRPEDKSEVENLEVEVDPIDLSHLSQNTASETPAESYGEKCTSSTVPLSYLCNLCNIPFRTVQKLYMHAEYVHADTRLQLKRAILSTGSRFKCDICPADFKRLLLLQYHKLQHRGIKYLTCPHCGKSYKRRPTLQAHILQNHRALQTGGPCTCRMCSGLGALAKRDKKKRRVVKSTNLEYEHSIKYSCKFCQVEFISKVEFRKHQRQSHKRDFECNECEYSTTRRMELINHLRVHYPVVYQCRNCSRSYEAYQQYRRHFCCDESGNYHYCTVCTKTFNKPHLLATHRLKHRLKLVCELCSKVFSGQETLKSHMIVVHGPRNFLCSLCGATFATKAQLEHHMTRHQDERFACPKCPRKFFTRQDLNNHKNLTHRDRCYVCSVCNRAIRSKHHFAVHMARHDNVMAYYCELCTKPFASAPGFKHHMRVLHNIVKQ